MYECLLLSTFSFSINLFCSEGRHNVCSGNALFLSLHFNIICGLNFNISQRLKMIAKASHMFQSKSAIRLLPKLKQKTYKEYKYRGKKIFLFHQIKHCRRSGFWRCFKNKNWKIKLIVILSHVQFYFSNSAENETNFSLWQV